MLFGKGRPYCSMGGCSLACFPAHKPKMGNKDKFSKFSEGSWKSVLTATDVWKEFSECKAGDQNMDYNNKQHRKKPENMAIASEEITAVSVGQYSYFSC